MPLWWLMCSTRVGPMPFGAAWWVGPCARTALLGGGPSAPTREVPAGTGPCLGLSLPPRWLMPRPVEFLWAPWAGGARNQTAPLGHQGAPAKSPFCQAWGVGCQCTRCVATAGAQTSGAQPLPPRWLTLAPRCAQAVACGRLHRCLRQRVLAGLPPGPGGVWVADARGMARGSGGALASHGGQV